MNRSRPNFVYAIILTRSWLGLLPVIFRIFVTTVVALDSCQNFVSAQYLVNKWTEFHQILYMHSYCHYLGLDCYLLISQICKIFMALDICHNFFSSQYR